jgi:hypothetical protein
MNQNFKNLTRLTLVATLALLISSNLQSCKGKNKNQEIDFTSADFNPETDSIPDALLIKLIDMNMEFTQFQRDAQNRMIEVIEKNGLTAKEFEEMWEKENNPLDENNTLKGDEKVLYDKINIGFDGITGDIQKMYSDKLAEYGFTEEFLSKIDARIQSDPSLQQRLNRIVMEKQSGMMPQGFDPADFDDADFESELEIEN